MEIAVLIDRFALRKIFAASAAFVVISCGGGGAATDATQAGPPPAEETGNPPGNQPSANIVTTPGTTFSPSAITIGQGAAVTWQIAGNTHNVTFGSAKPTGGDVPNLSSGNSATRTFPTAGTYPYDCTLHSGMSGTVIVLGSGPVVFTSIAVTPNTPAVNVGATVQLSASARDQNGTAMQGLPAATWSSSSNSIATVSSSGVVTGVAP